MIRLHYKHPAGPERTREFDSLTDAAKYGIAYYLTDNYRVSPRTAGHVAGEFEKHGEASCDGIDFWTVPDQKEPAA